MLSQSTPMRNARASQTARRPTPIYVNGHAVGNVTGDVFRKTVRGSMHFLHKPRAIAFDISTLHDAQKAGAVHVEVSDSETDAIYRAPIYLVLDRGHRFNRGYGDQVYLPLDQWSRPDIGQQLSLFAVEAA